MSDLHPKTPDVQNQTQFEVGADLLSRAQAATIADHELTWRQAARKYKKALFWACIFSFTLTMESTDLTSTGSFFGQDVFIDRFGQVVNGVKEISAPWQSGIQNGVTVGELIGLSLVGLLADKYGYRPTLIGMMVMLTVCLLLFAFANSLVMILIANILCGVPWGAFQSGCIAYASELVPTCLRPLVTAWVGVCWGLGFFTGSWIVRVCLDLPGQWSWRVPFLIQFVWPIPLLTFYWFCPESPYWLVRTGQMDKARATSRRLRDASNTTDEEIEESLALIDYTNKLELEQKTGSSYWDCFRGVNGRRTEMACLVAVCTNWGGNGMNAFTIQFLEQAGLSQTIAFDLNLVINSQYMTAGLFCIWLMTRLGRATIFLFGLFACDVILIAVGALGCIEQTTTVSWAVGILLLVMTVIYIVTVGPTSYTLIAEAPSSKLRAKTIVLSRAAFNICGVITNVIVPQMITPGGWNLGPKTAFFFAGTCTVLCVWAWFRLPETKGRTFGELDVLFESGLSARKWRKADVNAFENVGVRDEPASYHNDFEDDQKAVQGTHIETLSA